MEELYMVVVDDPNRCDTDFEYILCANYSKAIECIIKMAQNTEETTYHVEDADGYTKEYTLEQMDSAVHLILLDDANVCINGDYYRIVKPDIYGELCKNNM